MLSRSYRVALLLYLSLSASVSAQERQSFGTLQSLDLAVGTLSVSHEPKGQVKAFSLLKKDIPVANSMGGPLKLADLKRNDRLALTVANEEDVVAIRLESDLDWGVITGVDIAGKEVIAHIGQTPRPFKITDELRCSIDGKTGPAADLKDVKLWSHGLKILLNPDRTAVREMWINKGKYHSNPYCHRISVTGFLTSHDPVKKTLSLVTTDRYQTLEFEYDSWTQLRLIHSFQLLGNLPISRLKSPGKVSIGYDSDTRRTAVINLEAPTVSRRCVASIDRAMRKLTLEAADESPTETFLIAADAKIMRDGKDPRTLADVKEKCMVTLGLAPDQKEVWYLSFTGK